MATDDPYSLSRKQQRHVITMGLRLPVHLTIQTERSDFTEGKSDVRVKVNTEVGGLGVM